MRAKQQEQQQRAAESNKPTKKYDKIVKKIRKLVGASAQTFIPQLCKALRQDWYPYLSEEDIKQNKELRDSIRNKIFNDWSYESLYHSGYNIWSDRTVLNYLTDWLRNPIQQETTKGALEKAYEVNQQKIAQKCAISEQEKEQIDKVATELPDTVIPEEDPKTGFSDELMHDLGVAPYGETGKSIRQLTGGMCGGLLKSIAYLTNNDTRPTTRSDILVDYIKPSREFFRGLMLEIDSKKRAEISNYLYFIIKTAEDRFEIIREIDEKEAQ